MTKVDQKIKVTICSDLSYENLVAEIIIDGSFIGLVTYEPNEELCFVVPEKLVTSIKQETVVIKLAIDEATEKLLNYFKVE